MLTKNSFVFAHICVCVCVCKNWNATILVGDQQPLWGQNAQPHEFGDMFKAQNVV